MRYSDSELRVWVAVKPHELDQWSCWVSVSKHRVISHFLLCALHKTMLIKVMNSVSPDAFVQNRVMTVRGSLSGGPFTVEVPQIDKNA